MALAQAMQSYIDGDNGSFPNVYEAIEPFVRRTLHRFFRDAALVKDLTQDVFLKAHKVRFKFKLNFEGPVESCIFAWFGDIARNTAIDQFRKIKRYGARVEHITEDPKLREEWRLETCFDSISFIENLESKEVAREIVNDALMFLSPNQRSVVRRHKLDEIPYRELATEFGTKAGTLRVRTHRAMERLRLMGPTTPAGAGLLRAW